MQIPHISTKSQIISLANVFVLLKLKQTIEINKKELTLKAHTTNKFKRPTMN